MVVYNVMCYHFIIENDIAFFTLIKLFYPVENSFIIDQIIYLKLSGPFDVK